ncbi:hypothetical protein SAMN04488515_2389 [Cognatiyoonia koreensis]|uniref:Sensory transduction regulator n=1 Tax=Cognatiyoonia koreensis TaxID=364200 RepID=A0A1I0RAW3_9RHOB|nr:hypothetical protein [Cognatiyoonia koreensis]SEW37735.1 hypothetical protein SAMN04488515_2389 [Cognatiyoonia koreensis]
MLRTLALTLCLFPVTLTAQESEPAMTAPRMAEIVLALDAEAQITANGIEFTVDDVPVLIVMDVRADRMRAMVPIRAATEMTPEEMLRVMQANFDTALDARYAIAGDRLWGVFIHPLSPLEKDQLISGIAQTVNIANTYGTLFTGGAAQFGAGDSGALQRKLLEDLLEKGQDI